jgi:CRP-like cAMP-binding protein
MQPINRELAERILAGSGWLSFQSEAFRTLVLRRGILMDFAPGDFAIRFGDPPGGIFGLVSGVVAINTSPSNATPRLIHVASPGFWTGEGSYLTRQPRRVDMQAIAPTKLMHLPLSVMDQMEADEPRVVRNFAQIIMINVDTLIRIIHDLQQPDAARRIAAVLNRAGTAGGPPVPLSQSELGAMANASRKQVNAALQQFAKAGWLTSAYRAIAIRDGNALARFAAEGDD